MTSNEFSLLTTKRFLPLFVTQFLGAYNDNVFKNALILLITYKIANISGSQAQILVILAAGIFILPYFLFYLGLIFRYIPYNNNIFTTARFDKYFKYFLINSFIVELFGHLILNYGILNHLNSL